MSHIDVDVRHKQILSFAVTSAEAHGSREFEELLSLNTSRDLRADSACRSADWLRWLA